MITFSNPTHRLEIDDYPLGRSLRGKCVFTVEPHPHQAGKWRFVRQTTDPITGRVSKPKAATYGGRAVIVTGDDGRTYLIQHAGAYNFISVRRHDFLSAAGSLATDADASKHTAWPEDGEVFRVLTALLDRVYHQKGGVS